MMMADKQETRVERAVDETMKHVGGDESVRQAMLDAHKKGIAEASGTASASSGPGYSAVDVERAMAEAAAKAQAEGITDPDEIRDRMLAARKNVKAGGGA